MNSAKWPNNLIDVVAQPFTAEKSLFGTIVLDTPDREMSLNEIRRIVAAAPENTIAYLAHGGRRYGKLTVIGHDPEHFEIAYKGRKK